MKARRLRNALVDKDSKVVLIRQGNASKGTFINTLRLLKAKKLSSLEKPAKTVAVKGKKSSC